MTSEPNEIECEKCGKMTPVTGRLDRTLLRGKGVVLKATCSDCELNIVASFDDGTLTITKVEPIEDDWPLV